MDITQFRALMGAALGQEGLEEWAVLHRRPRVPNIWILPADDIVRFFWPHAYRRPWGFVYSGNIGVEIPELRDWLRKHRPDSPGIFHTCFVSYNILNEAALGEFMVEHEQPVPGDLWAGLLKDRLAQIPATFAGLVTAYRRRREDLGWLANPGERFAWDFLLKWLDDPDPSLHVPSILPDGRIV